MKVSEIMVSDVFTLSPEDTIAKAYSLMESKRVSQIPVVDGDSKYSGMIFAKQLISSSAQPTSKLKSFVVNTSTATPEGDVEKAAQALEEHAKKHEAFRKEVGRIANTIINGGKLENYGTPKAQEYLRKWAKEYGTPKVHDKKGAR